MTDNRRRLTFGDVADRALIGGVAILLALVARKMDKMSDQIEALLQTVTATVTRQEAGDKRIDRVERDLDQHFKEDRARFQAVEKGAR